MVEKIPVLDVRQGLLHADGALFQKGPVSVHLQTLRGGLCDGLRILNVNNGRIQFHVLVDRGMGVDTVRWNGGRLGWDSPIGQPVHPKFVNLADHGGLGWLVGFQEWMARCGVGHAGRPGVDNGVPLGLHGRIANIPASRVEVAWDDCQDELVVRGLVEEKMFKFGLFELWTELRTRAESWTLEFHDRLCNLSEYEREYQMIYHANYGPPLLDEGARFHAPVAQVIGLDDYAAQDIESFDRYRGPTRDFGEQVYCMRLHDDGGLAPVMLAPADRSQGVGMRYRVAELPAFILWKNTDTLADGYVTGLEPSTSFPLNRSVERERGRVPRLAPQESIDFHVAVSVLPDADAVDAWAAEIDSIQAGRAPEVIRESEESRAMER